MNLFIVLLLLVVAVIGLTVFLFLVKQTKFTYWCAITSVFIPINYINRYFHRLPSFAKWLPFGLLIVCFLAVLVSQIAGRKNYFSKKSLLFIVALCIFGAFSLVYNRASFLPSVFSGVGLISFFCFLFILNNDIYSLDTNSLFKTLIKFGILNSFVAIGQRVVLVALLHKSSDMVTGLFSVDGQYTFYQFFCLAIIVVYWFFDIEVTKAVNNFKIAFLFIFSIAVSGNVASLFFLPLMFFSIFFFVDKRIFLRKFRSFFIIVILLIGATLLYGALWQTEKNRTSQDNLFSLITDPNYLHDHLFGMDYDENSNLSKSGALRRGSALVFGYALISKSPALLFFGAGPGATSSTQLPGAEGSIAQEYEGFKVDRTSYSQTIAEMGIGGLVFIVIFLIMLYTWRSETSESEALPIIRKTMAIILILFFAYENVFNDLGSALVFASLLLRVKKSTEPEPAKARIVFKNTGSFPANTSPAVT